MRNNHIAFVIYPQYPHVGPTLPVVEVLIRRGYQITYVTSDQFASRVANLGAQVIECPRLPTIAAPEELTDPLRTREIPAIQLAARTLEVTLPFYTQNRPAILAYSYAALAGRILASRRNIPALQINALFAFVRNVYDSQVPDPQFRRKLLDTSSRGDRYLQEHGIAGSDWFFDREPVNIYLFPKALQPSAEAVDERCFYAGRCAGEQSHYGDWRLRTADGRPVVLVATSTQYVRGPDYFKLCIDALSALSWHVILSIGDAADPESLVPLPPNFEVVQHVSHVKILPYVSLFMCLGGIVSSAEAAYHGVPMLITSHGFPELEWQAENLAKIGVGIHLRKADTNVDNLRNTAVAILKDASIHDRVRRLRHLVRREPGAEDAANRIEEYLEARDGVAL